MSKFTITCREFKPFRRNTLVGFVQIRCRAQTEIALWVLAEKRAVAEIEDFARHDVIIRELLDGLCWWVIVHQLVQDKIHLRWPLAAPHDFYPDPPETIVRDVWRKRVPRDARDKSRELRRDALRTFKQYGEIS